MRRAVARHGAQPQTGCGGSVVALTATERAGDDGVANVNTIDPDAVGAMR